MTPLPKVLGEWLRCREWIIPALEYAGGTHTEEDVLGAVLGNRAHLWPGKNSAIVTEIETYPRVKVINFWLVGGDLEEVKEMQGPILKWAKKIGCSRAAACGRRGWERVLDEWKPQATVLGRDISGIEP